MACRQPIRATEGAPFHRDRLSASDRSADLFAAGFGAIALRPSQ